MNGGSILPLTDRTSTNRYLQKIAARLRQKEAENARGDLNKLEQLDQTQDAALLRKWVWIYSIYFAIFSFIVVPLLITVFQRWLPEMVNTLVWIFAKLTMALSLFLFGTAIYFTTHEKID